MQVVIRCYQERARGTGLNCQSVEAGESGEMDKSGEKSLQTAPSWDTKGTIITMASFMTTFITLGIVFSAGPIISEIVRAFDNQSTAKIAWIFSIMNGTSMLAGKFWRDEIIAPT